MALPRVPKKRKKANKRRRPVRLPLSTEKIRQVTTTCRALLLKGGPGRPVLASLALLAAGGAIATGAALGDTYSVCYAATVQGNTLVYFQDESAYQQALTEAQAQAEQILGSIPPIPQDVTLDKALAHRDRVAEGSQLTNAILDSIPQLEHVYTLYVDGSLVGASEDASVLYEALNQVKEACGAGERSLTLEFENQVSLNYEYLPAQTGTVTAQELTEKLLRQAPRTFLYTVQPGDTVEQLLTRFSMTIERLQELNPDQELSALDTQEDTGFGLPEDLEVSEEEIADLQVLLTQLTGTALEPGQTLVLEQLCPLLVVNSVEEQALTRDALPERLYEDDPNLFIGQQRVVQEGIAGRETALIREVKRCGVTVSTMDLSTVPLEPSTPLIIAVGTKPLPAGCLFLWPVQGPITSDYGYRFLFGETNFHQGVDIAAPMGTAICAGDNGQVIFAGERGTYGKLVIIQHANGFLSYYGHCSKLLVQAGDLVSQGQVIAAVGSTGRSTGPHCHFELRYDGNPIDPLLYLPGSNNAPARTQVEEEPEEEEPEDGEDPVEGETPYPIDPTQPEDPEQILPPFGEDPAPPPAEPEVPGEDPPPQSGGEPEPGQEPVGPEAEGTPADTIS
ncbi:MAG: peptidoglycan DD-metalloendopeptidase family protein [Ruminiclostridium sp.]|jgi:murein DD-endopeptidase MepM/ murein hydrolase activator NlpD|nr:peptidoglycan DD-metalloendopeptidase family protein [Ruminiclostridium sp.]